MLRLLRSMGFPESSVGKESAYDAGDPGSIPGSGKSPEEGIGYPLQYSWASLVAQLVKNPPAMQETWIQPLGWEDALEKGKAIPTAVLWPGGFHGLCNPWGCIESDMTERRSLVYYLPSLMVRMNLLSVKLCQFCCHTSNHTSYSPSMWQVLG